MLDTTNSFSIRHVAETARRSQLRDQPYVEVLRATTAERTSVTCPMFPRYFKHARIDTYEENHMDCSQCHNRLNCSRRIFKFPGWRDPV